MGAKKVIILGGEKAVSRNVENQLRNLGIKEIHRLAGGGRYETAVAIAEKLTVATQKNDTAILAYGMDFPDALSIALYAAQRGYPILLTETSRLSAATKKYLDSNQNIKHVIIVGGNAVIDKNVEDELKKNVIRIDGNHRYDRVMKEFGEKPKKVYIANGYSFADALTGSVLAAKEGVPLLLVETDHVPGATAEATRKIRTFTILGGDKVVSEKVKNTLLKK